MKFTDETVPVKCGVCDAYCEGLTDMICHLLQDHGGEYNQDEACKFAQIWVEQAHIQQDEQEQDYQLDRAIEADAFPNK